MQGTFPRAANSRASSRDTLTDNRLQSYINLLVVLSPLLVAEISLVFS